MAAAADSSSSSKRHFGMYHLQETASEAKDAIAVVVPDCFHHDHQLFDAFKGDEEEALATRPLVRRQAPRKKVGKVLRSVINTVIPSNRHLSSADRPYLGSRVVGTLFGHRKGNVSIAFQSDPSATPALLVELTTPTGGLVREMASGLVRIALECESRGGSRKSRGRALLEEQVWRVYCNGRKSGHAVARECTVGDAKLLQAVRAISMGAGVLPGSWGPDGELMYMRARFERVVGSRDSEAFYMMNPDGTGGTELSIFLLRV
ncbi:protein MIZU-KUSSEI 1-like [Nymphaea colorata]|uniref:Protein MIZU-KUSSEI 1 n=1 Tax=Nymphaea colorata TaxID=210225 RepID=A0A5K0WJ52_9MAGN|nr:protein MIZU-KUSSEI 1-like [Nymphaea colorata]